MGVHISFVRSVNLDSWNEKQLEHMKMGGNKCLREFFAKYDLSDEIPKVRFATEAASFYRKRLK